MVHERHKHHILLWERLDGQAYISIDPKHLTTEFVKRIKEDKDNKMGFKDYLPILKNKGYDIE